MGPIPARVARTLGLLAAAAILAVPVALAGDGPATEVGTVAARDTSGALVNESSHLYFLEFSGSKADFIGQAKTAGLKYTERFSYGRLFNGISVKLAPGERGKLGGFGSVKAVWPVHEVRLGSDLDARARDRGRADRRRSRERGRLHRSGREGGGHGHGHRLQPSRPRW